MIGAIGPMPMPEGPQDGEETMAMDPSQGRRRCFSSIIWLSRSMPRSNRMPGHGAHGPQGPPGGAARLKHVSRSIGFMRMLALGPSAGGSTSLASAHAIGLSVRALAEGSIDGFIGISGEGLDGGSILGVGVILRALTEGSGPWTSEAREAGL